MFSWFNAKKEIEFGQELAKLFETEMPIEIGKKQEKTVQRRKRTLEKILLSIQSYRNTNTLNIYKKAKLANAFKWYLIDAGYDDEIIEEITNVILTHL